MGAFFLIVAGVGMGGGAADVVTPNLYFTAGNMQALFTAPKAPQFESNDNQATFTAPRN